MELLKRQETWNITYDHALGETASYFFTQIRDNAKLFGRRDAKSGRVLVPPRAFSDQTLEPTKEWVEVGPGGQIEAFTIVYEAFRGIFKGLDLKDPAAAAKRLAIGTRVTTKFAEKRKGEVLDFWFELNPS
jgi:uncharacterized OB-fold protein